MTNPRRVKAEKTPHHILPQLTVATVYMRAQKLCMAHTMQKEGVTTVMDESFLTIYAKKSTVHIT